MSCLTFVSSPRARGRCQSERPRGARSGPAALAVCPRSLWLCAMQRSSHDPPIAALRGSCALPSRRVGYNADIREAPHRSSLPLRWRPRPLRRGAAECKRRAGPSRQARRPTAHSRRSTTGSTSRASKIRSSNPSNRPHSRIAPGPAASSRTRAWVSGSPRGRQRQHRAAHRATLSIAAASTSARSTIPAPPPAGVSSTLRCLSVAKSRMLRVSSDHRPSASARPARLTRQAARETSPDRG